MANPAVEELRSSLELLYSTRVFSDLQIVTSERTHHVHKAVVCPRSRYLAEACRQAPSGEANNSIIKLLEDDPKAIDAVIHFFYKLDYPSDSSLIVHEGGSDTNGVNGDHIRDGSQASVRTEEPSSSLDDFLPINVSKNALKQRKKRAKRRKSLSVTPPYSPGTATGVAVPDVDTADNREEEGAPLVQQPVPVNGSGVHHSLVEEPARQEEGGLVFHAKVYDLSKKLGIDCLRALSLQKFESETEDQWASKDFVQAVSEISSLVTGDEIEEGKVRDIVLNVLCEHRELINNEGMESVIRGLDLAYDLVKLLTQRGLIAM